MTYTDNARFQVLTAASMMFRVVFWVILPCKMIVDRRFRGPYCLHHQDNVAGQVIRNWVCREHQKYWHSIPGQRNTKNFTSKLSAKRTVEFLKLNQFQARQVTGLLTGHCHLKGPTSSKWE
jgi:hypothetical protein